MICLLFGLLAPIVICAIIGRILDWALSMMEAD
jgi:hypothetical protein